MTELTIDQALRTGIEAHKSGQVQEADRLYTAILKAQPKHPDANHNMGVLAVGVGKVQEALPFFKTALEANPDTAQFWLSYIDALIKLERLVDAKAVFDQAKSKGAKSDGFDQLEQRLKAPKDILTETVTMSQVADQDRPNILDTLKLDQAIKLAKKKFKEGTPEEAKRIYQDVLVKFPKNKGAVDGLKGVSGGPLGKAPKVQDPPQDQLEPLINLYRQGQLQQALEQATILLQQFPNSSILYNINGAVYKGLGQLDASIGAYKQALSIKPDYAHAYNNIGTTLKYQGKLEEAIAAYNKALVIKPDNAATYNNMGNALKEQGKRDEAIEAYNKALTIKPDYAEAYNNMGNALKGVSFTQPKLELQKTIGLLLDQKNLTRPKDIARAAISLLKFEPNLQKHLQTPNIDKSNKSLQQTILEFSKLPLLLKLMSICPLPDLGIEALLKEVRAKILLSLPDLDSTPSLIEFQSALALQCFTNEYIYDQNASEERAIEALEASVEAALSRGEQPSPKTILCLASYNALHEYKWCNLLTDNSEICHVFLGQVREPKLEIGLKSSMPILEEITNEVSVKVRAQYEDNPYPRWVDLELSLNPEPITKVVSQSKIELFDKAICEVGEPDILVAGCGTGQHSIGTAARFKNSNVLAIDLSLSSLAYAKRKTEELGITNINYMQADILKLQKLDRQFDIIESAGVLHHMDNPMAGWRVLTDCLKPGGLMNIGLYSECARQNIVEMRKEITQSGIGSSDSEMKSFRTGVINSDKEHHKGIMYSNDFYSLSTLRDLLFHVQEHRFTIPQLKQCMEALGLKFCGFEYGPVVQKFRLTNIGSDDPYDLDKWQTYEEANPRTFAGMYQFWCQKVV